MKVPTGREGDKLRTANAQRENDLTPSLAKELKEEASAAQTRLTTPQRSHGPLC